MSEPESRASMGSVALEPEEDVCRVCRVEADEGHPMMHPCKCSGSVKFVHSDCLKSWLATSQKRYCEICGHRYTFTKVYPDYLPTVIPIIVYVRQSLLYIFRWGVGVARAVLVAFSWLVLLPAFNMAAMRTVFHLSDQLAKGMVTLGVLARPSVMDNGDNSLLQEAVNATTAAVLAVDGSNGTDATDSSEMTIVAVYRIMRTSLSQGVAQIIKDIVRGLKDSTFIPFILRGQILSLCLAGLIIAVIFLREWMTQHNWAQHDEEKKPLPKINPDEWEVKGGIATKIAKQRKERKHRSADSSPVQEKRPVSLEELLKTKVVAKLPKEALEKRIDGRTILSRQDAVAAIQRMAGESSGKGGIPRSESEPVRPESWGLGLADSIATRDATPSTRATGSITPPRSAQGQDMSMLDFLADSPYHDDSSGSAEAGPGPSTLAHRRNSSGSAKAEPEEALEMKEQRLEAARRALSQTQSDVVWQAPEMLRRGDGETASAAETKAPELSREEVEQLLDDLLLKAGHVPRNASDPGIGNGLDERIHTPTLAPILNGYAPLVDVPPGPPPERPDEDAPRLQIPAVAPAGPPPVIDIPDVGRIVVRPPRAMGEMPEDDEDEWEDVPVDRDAPMPEIAVVGAEGNGEGGDGQPLLEDEMEMEGGWEWDDIEGLLEVIGLIGPITNLLQNVTLAIIFMSATLALLVDLPMTIGKLFLVVDLIWAFAHTGKLVYKGLRFIVDPLVDIGLELLKAGLYRPGSKWIAAFAAGLSARLPPIPVALPTSLAFPVVQLGGSSWTSKISAPIAALRQREDLVEKVGDAFALIGNYTYQQYETYRRHSLVLVASDEIVNRTLCVLLGYAVSFTLCFTIALASGVSFGKGAKGLAGTVRIHALYAKLCFFMALELAAFPLATGVAISLALVPIFPEVTVESRLMEIVDAPFGNLFICWLCGTSFMYTFAQGLNWLRSMCRPGAMFFIRDPHDPKFSPVKDIIERPIPNQIRKLWTSALLYGFLVWCMFGAGCWGIASLPTVDIFPLRTNAYGPLSSTPFDLVFLLVALPQTTSSVDLRAWVKRVIGLYWSYAPHLFHLDSLVHGKPTAIDQRSEPLPLRLFYTTIDPLFRLAFGQYSTIATFARVPAQDQIILLASRGERGGVFIPVTPDGVPKTPQDKLRLLKQNAAAIGENRDPKKDYTVLWLPHWWRTRVHLFVVMTAIMAGVGVMALFLTPLIVGRGITGVFFGKIHDGYNLLAGFYVLQFLLHTGSQSRSIVLALLHAKPYNPFRRIGFTRYKRKTLRAARAVYTCIVLFGVLPLLTGLLLELRIGLLARYGLRPGVVVVHLWDSWAMGAVLLALQVRWDRYRTGGRVHLPPTPRERLRGMYEMPILVRTRRLHQVVLPIIRQVLVGLVAPFVWSACSSLILARAPGGWQLNDEMRAINFRLAGPSTWFIILLLTNARHLHRRLSKLKQTMIDREYVVEERVENYEGPTQDEEAAAAMLAKGIGNPNAAEVAEVLREGGEILVDVERPGRERGRGEIRIEVGEGGRMEVWQEGLGGDVEDRRDAEAERGEGSEGEWEDTDEE